MGYTIDPILANCYPGTTVLVNKFDIRDEQKLNEIESVISSARYAEWENAPKENTFDFEHYKAVHRYLFSDLYSWAGEVRTVNISKKGTAFTPADAIETQATFIFNRLNALDCFRNLAREQFIDEIVDFYCVTNTLHPFREGNGRAQRAFLSQLIRHSGHSIDFAAMDAELLMIATIQAAQGITNILHQIFNDNIK